MVVLWQFEIVILLDFSMLDIKIRTKKKFSWKLKFFWTKVLYCHARKSVKSWFSWNHMISFVFSFGAETALSCYCTVSKEGAGKKQSWFVCETKWMLFSREGYIHLWGFIQKRPRSSISARGAFMIPPEYLIEPAWYIWIKIKFYTFWITVMS